MKCSFCEFDPEKLPNGSHKMRHYLFKQVEMISLADEYEKRRKEITEVGRLEYIQLDKEIEDKRKVLQNLIMNSWYEFEEKLRNTENRD